MSASMVNMKTEQFKMAFFKGFAMVLTKVFEKYTFDILSRMTEDESKNRIATQTNRVVQFVRRR